MNQRSWYTHSMEKCYEYFDCNKTECIMFQKNGDQHCWETEGTLCFFLPLTSITKAVNQKEKCDFCLYKGHILLQKNSNH